MRRNETERDGKRRRETNRDKQGQTARPSHGRDGKGTVRNRKAKEKGHVKEACAPGATAFRICRTAAAG